VIAVHATVQYGIAKLWVVVECVPWIELEGVFEGLKLRVPGCDVAGHELSPTFIGFFFNSFSTRFPSSAFWFVKVTQAPAARNASLKAAPRPDAPPKIRMDFSHGTEVSCVGWGVLLHRRG
jgi:hypothetical protein